MDASFGIGVYSLPEAGRLLNVPSSTIRHWLFGYSYSHHGPMTKQAPLWHPQYGLDQDEPLLGFRDLLEARIVRGLRNSGLGLQTIRDCLKVAREIVSDDHPFSTRKFKTDGNSLYLEIEDRVLDLKKNQLVFRKVIAPSFVDLDYDVDSVSRWWLNPSKRTIVLDPQRSFGQPIVADTGVSTRRIAQVVAAEGSIEAAARLFELSPSLVRDALAFERRTVH